MGTVKIMNKVKIVFKDGYEFIIPAFVNEQFYLFDSMESLTLFVPDTDETCKLMTDNEHMHFCRWGCYVAPDDTPYEDVTIDFLSVVSNISIISDNSSWYEAQRRFEL